MSVEVDERGQVRLACAAMGTRFEVLLHGGDPAWLHAAGEAALDEVLLWHGRLSAFEPSSVVSAINRSGGEWCRVDGETFALLRLCREVWERTGGAFDPTVGALMRAWGFRGEPMDDAAVGRARASTGMRLVELDEDGKRVKLRAPGVRLDLGAVGKGWALDRAAGVLREGGVENALMHGGTSSVIGMGVGADGDAWRVAVGAEADSPRVELRNAALGVSAHRGRQVIADGVEVGHVIDPRAKRPVAMDNAEAECAAVVHASAAMADAFSTALLLRPELRLELECSTAVLMRRGDGIGWEVRSPDRCVFQNSELIHG
jgi:thiamine biosynthesis lipoprotein